MNVDCVTLRIYDLTNLWLDESITLRIYHFTNLLLYESITLRIYHFTNLSLYESITLRMYDFTNLVLYESITLRIYYFTDLFLWAFLKVRNSEVSHPNFLWSLLFTHIGAKLQLFPYHKSHWHWMRSQVEPKCYMMTYPSVLRSPSVLRVWAAIPSEYIP